MFGLELEGAPWEVILLVLLLIGSWTGFIWFAKVFTQAWLKGEIMHIREHKERIEALQLAHSREVTREREVNQDYKLRCERQDSYIAEIFHLTRGVQQTATEATTTLSEVVVKERDSTGR